MSKFVDNNVSNLADGFKYGYIALLSSLAKFEYDAVASACETQLFKAFADGMDKMRASGY